jgi:hypothetical protein
VTHFAPDILINVPIRWKFHEQVKGTSTAYFHTDQYPTVFFFNLVCEAIGTAATPAWPIVPASGHSEDDCGEADGMYIGRGNRSSRRKPAPAPLLSITKSHISDPGLNPGRRSGKPATNRLSYGADHPTVFCAPYLISTKAFVYMECVLVSFRSVPYLKVAYSCSCATGGF